MLQNLFAMTLQEEKYKQRYLHGGSSYMEKPVSYQEFQLLEWKDKAEDETLKAYHEAAEGIGQGSTVKDPEQDGKYIEVVRHQRYCLPLLHNHAYVEMVYVMEGNCIHFVEQQQFPMKKGDICILAPNAMHAISVTDDETVLMNIMMSRKIFDASFLNMIKGDRMMSEFLAHILYNKRVSPYLMFRTDEDPRLQKTVLEVYRECQEKAYLYNESVLLYVKQIFIHLIRHYQMMAIMANPIDNTQENNIVALMGYITVNYNHITLKETASFFGYSEIYLGQIIQKYTGKTFPAIVNQLQMEHARQLLADSHMNITEISAEVGCYDASHFSRKFKQAFGMTPSAYRKENIPAV